MSEYLYFDKGKLFAQFIFNHPVIGFDFEIEVNIYLRDRSLVQILFGRASQEQVEELIAGFMYSYPHVIQTVTWYVDSSAVCYIANCGDTDC